LDFPCFLTSLPQLITLLAKNFANFNKEELALKNFVFYFVLFSLIRIFDLRSKILSFDNKNKNFVFYFVLFSLIRIFADSKRL